VGFSVTGVNSTDDRDFVAHVTIAKTSKVKGHQRKRGSPKKIAEVCSSRAVALHQQSTIALWDGVWQVSVATAYVHRCLASQAPDQQLTQILLTLLARGASLHKLHHFHLHC